MMTAGYHTPLTLFHDQEWASLRRRALFAGLVLLIFLALQLSLSELEMIAAQLLSRGRALSFSGWLRSAGPAAPILYSMVQYVILLGVPIGIGLIFCRKTGAAPLTGRRTSAPHAVALLAAGIATCVFANFVSAYLTEWLSYIGLEPLTVPSSQNGTLPILLLSLLSTAVLPAIMEELLFRGIVLQLLRPAGDLTALLLSSVLFGVTHGTVEQIPFAIVVGLACGYFVLKTGNIYLAMALHFLNNASAVILEGVLLNASDAVSSAWTYTVFAGMTLLGLVGWLYLRHSAPHAIAPVYDGRSSWMSRGERRCAVCLHPTILIYTLLMLMLTVLSATINLWLPMMNDLLGPFGGWFYG